MKKNFSSFLLLSVFLLLIVSILYSYRHKTTIRPVSNPTPTISANSIKVIRIIDGDTIEIEGGAKVRYIGIDTPEIKHPAKSVQCYGLEASLKNKELVEGKYIRLEKDVSEVDRYGRLLRYVFVKTESSPSGLLVNDYLVREGYAHSSTFPPDVKYQRLFLDAEKKAREQKRGLWNSCSPSQ